ncbi:hypothetical protein [Prescottella agglutinans]|uniref:DNA-binding protein n=1 Tax=Prescottella agglutinans TaxID=1644129 RepID=A0ABT6MI37_9NOCA|nr:hypothetical protein [Prescottella agglutinans]MDH6283983.1 hypothetical protein [Prescottella agglutinans]
MPNRRTSLAELTDAELVRTVVTELDRRRSFAAVRDQVTALLAMGPTLTEATEAGVGQLIEDALVKARALMAEQALILDQPLFTAVEVSQVLGARGNGNRSAASRLRARGDIIGLDVQGRFVFPAFQFDLPHARVHPVVAEVNHQLGAFDDPWGAARWWVTKQGRTAPMELVGQGEKRLRTLAAKTAAG